MQKHSDYATIHNDAVLFITSSKQLTSGETIGVIYELDCYVINNYLSVYFVYHTDSKAIMKTKQNIVFLVNWGRCLKIIPDALMSNKIGYLLIMHIKVLIGCSLKKSFRYILTNALSITE